MDYIEMSHESLPEAYSPDFEDLKTAESEAPFMEASFYMLREATHWMAILSSLKPASPLDRNRAIMRGLLVRLTKLMRLAVRELASQETFMQLSITRDTIETAANMQYLLQDPGDGERFDQYVMNSLVAERELLRDIQRNLADRGGDEWPIEKRMKRSIEATAKAAGIDDVTSLPGRSKIGFPSIERRVELLGLDAYIAYRMGSVETHGDWHDLFRNHLNYDDGAFSPKVKSMHVRPQVPLMLTILPLTLVVSRISDLVDDADVSDFIRPKLEDTLRRAREIDRLHEEFLSPAPPT
ncbi:DUF5677 domain-containing protein [Amycolatopsis sp. lyj-109]|uniref:DUF5677 domain-containing protein n=1 Tax=Amycolatopsis sp. lyj-109 TaxID=2789287 RepID=UPI00397A3459